MKRSKVSVTLVLATVTLLMIGGVAANAQSWSTSKAVNKVANKSLFEDEELAKTHITASSSTQPSPVSQKGVSRAVLNSGEYASRKGNVASKGTPSIAISKGVHQYSNRPNTSDAKQKNQEVQPVIPIDKKESFKQ